MFWFLKGCFSRTGRRPTFHLPLNRSSASHAFGADRRRQRDTHGCREYEPCTGENNYVPATVGLYASFFNLFTSLLSLFGFSGSDD